MTFDLHPTLLCLFFFEIFRMFSGKFLVLDPELEKSPDFTIENVPFFLFPQAKCTWNAYKIALKIKHFLKPFLKTKSILKRN